MIACAHGIIVELCHRTLELLEHYVLSLTVSTDQTDIGFKSSNLVAHRIAIDSPHRYGYASYNYDFYSGTDDDFTDSSSVLGKNASTDSLPDVAVRIPRSVLLRADAAQNKTASTRRLPLVILVYRTDKLFSRKDQDNATHRINSNVVSVSFSGSSLTNLTEPITVTLEHTDKVRLQSNLRILTAMVATCVHSLQCGEDPRCVYWNSTESGTWLDCWPVVKIKCYSIAIERCRWKLVRRRMCYPFHQCIPHRVWL